MNAVLGDLPTWNLADLYSSPTGPDLDRDLKRAAADAEAFAKAYEGRIAALSGKELGEAVARYEALSDLTGRIGSFASLYYAQDQADSERGSFSQNVSEALNEIGSKLIFFRLELNRLDDATLDRKLSDASLARFRPWLRDLRVFRPHQLADDLEKLLHEKEVTGHSAWNRLFDETMAALRIDVGGESLNVSGALNKLSDRDRSVREAAGKAVDLINNNPTEARKHLVKNTFTPDDVVDTVPMIRYFAAKDLTAKDKADFQKFIDFSTETGTLTEKVDVNKYLQAF